MLRLLLNQAGVTSCTIASYCPKHLKMRTSTAVDTRWHAATHPIHPTHPPAIPPPSGGASESGGALLLVGAQAGAWEYSLITHFHIYLLTHPPSTCTQCNMYMYNVMTVAYCNKWILLAQAKECDKWTLVIKCLLHCLNKRIEINLNTHRTWWKKVLVRTSTTFQHVTSVISEGR